MRQPHWTTVGCLALCFVLVANLTSVAKSDDLSSSLSVLQAVGPQGAGNRAAAKAWAVVAAADASELPTILAALDKTHVLAANWICPAVDAVAQRALQQGNLPKADLEKYLLDTQHNPRSRRLAYELLAQVDKSVPGRFLPQMLNDPSVELRYDAVTRLIIAAETADKKEEKSQATTFYQQAFDAARDLNQVKALAGWLKKRDVQVDLPQHFGLLTHWCAIGPFDNTGRKGFDAVYPPEEKIDLAANYPGKGGQVSWTEYTTTDELGMFDFCKVWNKDPKKEKSVVAYATTTFMATAQQEVEFRFATVNATKLWLNGKLISKRRIYHAGSEFDQYTAIGTLKPGKNVILIKVCQNEQTEAWTHEWKFQLRVCDASGTAIRSAAGAGKQAGSKSRSALPAVAYLPQPGVWAPVAFSSDSHVQPAAGWMQYHGTEGTSVSAEKNLPITFDDQHNVAWKVPLQGRGPSSPIVVGDRIIVTSATGPHQDRLHVFCFSTVDGKLLWQRQFWATGAIAVSPFAGVAAPTPASDGVHVVVFYSSNDLACFDLEGNLQWFRGLGWESPGTRNDVGMASSPLIVGNTVVVQAECQAGSFAAGLDLDNGLDRWHNPRDPEATWTSPMLLPGKTPSENIALLQSKLRLTAIEPATGKQVWEYEGSCHTMATGTVVNGDIYIPGGGGMIRLQPNAAGNDATAVWKDPRLSMGATSPIVHDGKVYVIKSAGVLVCADATTHQTLWQTRVKGPFWASPVLADGHLYIVSHEGLVQVVDLATQGKVIKTSQIDKEILASPAVADGAIYFRANNNLWKVKQN